MYLYLGKETVINTSDIVGIFDLENTSTSRLTKAFLAASQKSGQVVVVSVDLPKSYVVTERKGQRNVYLIQIAPSTLRKRCGHLNDLTGQE